MCPQPSQHKRFWLVLQRLSRSTIVTVSCLMLAFTIPARTLDDTMTDADWAKIETLIENSSLNRWNFPEYMRRLAYEDMNDSNRVEKAMEGDFTNRVRRDVRNVFIFIQDPRVGLPWSHLLVFVLVPFAVLFVWYCTQQSKRSTT